MNIHVSIKHLAEGLRVLEGITTKHPSLPLLETVLLSVVGKDLVLRATNLDSGIEYTIPAKITTPGACACSPHILLSALIGSDDGDVSLIVKDGVLQVVTQSGDAAIKTLPVEDFPTLPKVSKETGKTLEVSTKELGELLRSVVFAVAHTDIKPELACVFFSIKNNTMVAVATDAFRLAERKITLSDPTPDSNNLLIPGKVVQDFIKVLEVIPSERITVFYTDTQVAFSTGFWFVTGRLVQGNYPNYSQIIPKTHTTKAIIFRKDIQNILKSLSLFSDKDLRMDISIDPKKKTITCVTDSHNVGRAQYGIPGVIEGEAIDVRINYRYLNDVLSQITDDSISITSTGSSAPLVIQPVRENGFLCLVMPMFK